MREGDLPAPSGDAIRAPGLWLSLTCETPGEHWSVGLEAFALAVDDPDDERGDLVALGLDVEWEAPGRLTGELVVRVAVFTTGVVPLTVTTSWSVAEDPTASAPTSHMPEPAL